jgi:hypothetical protein
MGNAYVFAQYMLEVVSLFPFKAFLVEQTLYDMFVIAKNFIRGPTTGVPM